MPFFGFPTGIAAAQGRPQTGAPLRVETVEATRVPFAQTLAAVGTLRANEAVVLFFELSRRLTGIHFEEKSAVAKDELPFKLDDSDLVVELGETDARCGWRRRTRNEWRCTGCVYAIFSGQTVSVASDV